MNLFKCLMNDHLSEYKEFISFQPLWWQQGFDIHLKLVLRARNIGHVATTQPTTQINLKQLWLGCCYKQNSDEHCGYPIKINL